MNIKHISDEEMFRLVDGECTLDEKKNFEAHLKACASCKALFTKISTLDLQLHQMILETPSKEFTEHLIHKLQAAPVLQQNIYYTKAYSLILAPIAFILCLVVVLFSGASLGWFTHTTLPLTGTQLNITLDLNYVQALFQNKSIITLFMWVNGIVALLIFDKIVLQPYFKKKINQTAR